MELDVLPSIFTLFYTVGEILTMTWPGRLVLGMVLGSVISKIARS
jgi:hypothetical protein